MSEETVVLVDRERWQEAREFILRFQSRHRASWNCPACGSNIDSGYRWCWNCDHNRIADTPELLRS